MCSWLLACFDQIYDVILGRPRCAGLLKVDRVSAVENKEILKFRHFLSAVDCNKISSIGDGTVEEKHRRTFCISRAGKNKHRERLFTKTKSLCALVKFLPHENYRAVAKKKETNAQKTFMPNLGLALKTEQKKKENNFAGKEKTRIFFNRIPTTNGGSGKPQVFEIARHPVIVYTRRARGSVLSFFSLLCRVYYYNKSELRREAREGSLPFFFDVRERVIVCRVANRERSKSPALLIVVY